MDLMSYASPAVGGLLGMATAEYQDRRQRRQANYFQGLQIQGQKEMGEFNRQQALKMWEDTNYSAQREQLEKAGLNVGLMYGMGGGGGVTANTQSGNVSGQSAQGGSGEIGMGIQLGLQSEMMKAQIEATKAQAEKTRTETNKIAGVDTESGYQGIEESKARINQIVALTNNEMVKNSILNWENRLKEIETYVSSKSQDDLIQKIAFEASVLQGQAKSSLSKGYIDQNTADQIIKQSEQETLIQQLEIGMLKQGLINSKADLNIKKAEFSNILAATQKLITERAQSWDKLNLQERDTIVKEAFAAQGQETVNFATSTPEKIRQWTSIITDIAKAAGTAAGGFGIMKGK